jgi:Flp pilus assembly protein TadG
MSGRVSPLGAVRSDRIGATGRVIPEPVAVLRGLVRNDVRPQRSFPRQQATSNQCRLDTARRGAGRRGLRARFGACRGDGRDRGASAVELAILAPALLFASLLIIQFALWFDARHAALAAAQQGDLVAREDEFVNQAGWAGLAQTAATTYYAGLDTSVLSAVTAKAKPGQANTVSVTVKGKLTGVWPLTITETVTGPIECFRTQVSQGAACG